MSIESGLDMSIRTGILVAIIAMASVVVISNILVHFLIGEWLTYAAFTYPFAFLITDLSNRVYGPRVARLIVLVGFITGIIGSLVGTQIIGEFGPLVTLRVAIASGTAFLISQLLDVRLFSLFLDLKHWWKAPLVSSLIGGLVDTLIFFSLAFDSYFSFLEVSNDVSWANLDVPLLGFGFLAPLWISLALADFIVKFGVVCVSLIPFKLLLGRLLPVTNTYKHASSK